MIDAIDDDDGLLALRAARCALRAAPATATAEVDTYHIANTNNPAAPRAILQDRELFARVYPPFLMWP